MQPKTSVSQALCSSYSLYQVIFGEHVFRIIRKKMILHVPSFMKKNEIYH